MFSFTMVLDDVGTRLHAHTARLHQQLALVMPAPMPPTVGMPSPLRDDLTLLVQIANGEIDRHSADAACVGEVVDCVGRVIDLLFTPPFGHQVATLPDLIWAQPGIGQVLAHVHAWLRQDDLIGLTEAAQLLFPALAASNLQAARMRVKRLVARGALMAYVDPSETNPTRQTRVSRQVVETLRAHGAPSEHD
jgi:hypothetical protein